MSLFDRLSRKRKDRELDEEIEAHLAMAKQERMDRGESPRAAELGAHSDFGNQTLIKELTREMWGWNALDHLCQDVRLSLRGMGRNPGFTIIAVLTLALGIGSTTLVFSVIEQTAFSPDPYVDQHRLVAIDVRDIARNVSRRSFSPQEFLDYEERSDVFDGVWGATGDSVLYRAAEGAERFSGFVVTPNTFQFYRMAPLFGRVFRDDDGKPNAAPVFIMSYKLWSGRFGSDQSILNRTFALNGIPRTLVGVMPRAFESGAEIWIPSRLTRSNSPAQDQIRPLSYTFYGHLKPGVSRAQADADLDLLAHQLAKIYPRSYPDDFQVHTISYAELSVGTFRPMLFVMLGAVGLVLLIACGNVANMLLARAIAREKEFAIQVSLGGGPIQVIRRLLLESLLLAIGGAGLGLVLAWGGLKAIVALMPKYMLSFVLQIRLANSGLLVDLRVLLFSVLVTLLAVLIVGLIPALQVSRRNIDAALRDTGKGTNSGSRHGRLRNALVVGEVALVLTLLLGTGFLIRRVIAFETVSWGFEPDHILVVYASLPPARYKNAAAVTGFYRPLLTRLRALPGARNATVSTWNPPLLTGGSVSDVDVPGLTHAEKWNVFVQLADEDYFETFRTRFLQGRGFNETEMYGARKVAVINETFAKKYLNSDDPIGRQVRLLNATQWPDPVQDPSFEIVGVVADMKNDGPLRPAMPQAWLPYTITGSFPRLLQIRTAQNPLTMLREVRQEITNTDPDVASNSTLNESLEDYMDDNLFSGPHFTAIILSIFAGLGLVLAALGVYGVMTFETERQTHEIGIRMALGAGQNEVLSYVVGKGLRLIAIGCTTGLLASFGLMQLLGSHLGNDGGIFDARINISPRDPLTLGAVIAVLLVSGFAAIWVPALRATRVDPAIALRHE